MTHAGFAEGKPIHGSNSGPVHRCFAGVEEVEEEEAGEERGKSVQGLHGAATTTQHKHGLFLPMVRPLQDVASINPK